MGFENLVGQTLGQYELREILGTGGMGAVYRGHQANLNREVAVKVLPSSFAQEPGYIARFNREAEVSASLEHAHIVPIYDYGTQRGISYVVMRLLTGGSLADRLRHRALENGPLPSMGEVTVILHQLADALDYAHSRGVIHRDLKPGNIMFDHLGNALVVDFGIAKLMNATTNLTGTGVEIGTPSFMSPEQWRSDPLTPSADQYAMAVVVYSVLTGRLPFEADTPFQMMHKHLNELPTPPQTYRPEVPRAVASVLDRALAKEPGERFPTMVQFAQSFEDATRAVHAPATGFFVNPVSPAGPRPRRSGQPTPAITPQPPTITPTPRQPTVPLTGLSPATPLPPIRPPRRRSNGPVIALALIAVILLAVVIAFAARNLIGGASTPTPEPTTPAAVVLAPSVTPSGQEAVASATSGSLIIIPNTSPEATATVQSTDTPVPSATASETHAPTATAVSTDTPAPTDTRSPTETSNATAAPLVIVPTEKPSDTPAPTASETREPSATPTDTSAPTATPSETTVPTDTSVPTDTEVPASATPPPLIVIVPTDTPTERSSATPTETVTSSPVPTDTAAPTNTSVPASDTPPPLIVIVPTDTPTERSSATPTETVTSSPVPTDTLVPTDTQVPSATPGPTDTPTVMPTLTPIDTTPRVISLASEGRVVLVHSGDGTVDSFGLLLSGESAPIVAISNLSGWLKITLPDGRAGWVSPDEVRLAGDLSVVLRYSPTALPTSVPRVRSLSSAGSWILVHSGDGSNDAFAVLQANQTAAIIGISDVSGWLFVELDDGRTGWVAPTLIEIIGDTSSVIHLTPTVTPTKQPTATLTPSQTPTRQPPTATPTISGAQAATAGFSLGGHVNNITTRSLTAVRRAHMSWIKVELTYTGNNDVYAAANAIAASHALGFNVLLTLIGDKNLLAANGDSYLSAYAAFTGTVAGLRPEAIEIWPETNIDRFWPTNQISGAAYVNVLRQAFQAIKGANDGVMVITGAPAPTGAEGAFPGAVWNDDHWLGDVVANGGLQYADCVGVHYLEGIVPPGQTSGDPRNPYYTRYLPGMTDTYWNIIGGQKRLCYTELGYLSPEGYGPVPDQYGWAANTTVAEQAEWLAEARTLLEQDGKTRMMIVGNVDATDYGDDPQGGYAIIRPDGSCPACDTLAGTQPVVATAAFSVSDAQPTDTPANQAGGQPIALFNQAVNVRRGPGGNFTPPIGSFAAGDTTDILAVNPSGTWYKIRYHDSEGWVAANLVMISGDASNLSVDIGPATPVPPTPTPLPTNTPKPKPSKTPKPTHTPDPNNSGG